MDTTQRRLYIISDTHFRHRNIAAYTGRDENFDEIIIANWQRLVSPNDTVIHMGDVQLGRESDFASIQDQLPGTKILLEGNHDRHHPQWYLDRGFHAVFHSIRMGEHGEIMLTHAPIIPLPEGVKYLLHGHFHNANDRRLLADHPQENIDYYHAQGDRYALVEIESTLSPVLFSDFCAAHNIKL